MYPTDYIVVGPIRGDLQRVTGMYSVTITLYITGHTIVYGVQYSIKQRASYCNRVLYRGLECEQDNTSK